MRDSHLNRSCKGCDLLRSLFFVELRRALSSGSSGVGGNFRRSRNDFCESVSLRLSESTSLWPRAETAAQKG